MSATGKTVAFGDFTIPVTERDWLRVPKQLPYRKTYLLKPGQSWHDAPVDPASSLSEWYVQLPDGPVPSGAVAARELLAEGASLALWTECYGGGRVVFMSPDLTCVEATGELGEMLRAIKAANNNKWAGLPDAIGEFPDGRVIHARREACRQRQGQRHTTCIRPHRGQSISRAHSVRSHRVGPSHSK